MEEKNKINEVIIDGEGHEITYNENDFDFVQSDTSIHDLKLKSKPTTFLKDAIRRFFKSKSAIVGFSIVGILFLGSLIIPLCTPDQGVFNVDKDGGGSSSEFNLVPKLFNAGSGFWDGTVKRTKILYDKENEVPVGYREGTFFNLKSYEEEASGVFSTYASGGYLNVYQTNSEKNANYYSPLIDFDFTNNYSLSYNLLDEAYGNYEFTGIKVSLFDGNNHYYLVGKNNFSKDLNANININETLTNNGYDLSTISKAKIYFDIQKSDNTKTGNVFIKDCLISSNNSEEKETLDAISFKDGNEVMCREAGTSNAWAGDFGKTTYKITVPYCDFTFDMYESVYGLVDKTYGYLELQVFASKGGMKINFSSTDYKATTDKEVLKNRFQILDENECPIAEVVEQVGDATYNSSTKRWTGYSLKVKIENYKVLGYSSMPRYIFGTNGSGKDYLKLMFKGLRFSLLLAIGVSFVNIVIGLIWGSISGYFGGWTDIIMERICDIISGLPTMVIITLCILYGRELNWGSLSDVLALMISLFMTGWMGVSARTRTQFYRYKGREYILASRTLGAKDGRLIFKHILPNSAGTIITSSVLMIPSVIYTEASIAYLGLGLQNQVLFGVVLSEASTYYSGEKSYLLLIPTVIMMFLLVSFNLFGNGLRDAFNPQLKGGE